MNKPNSLTTTRKRLLIIALSITFLFSALFFRLGYIQLIQGKDLQKKASQQWYRDLPLNAPRGKIMDSSGEILADNKDVYTVYVRPRAVKDFNLVASELAAALDLDKDSLYEKLSQTKVSEITVARKVDPENIEGLKAQNIEGIYFAAETKRNYPNGQYLSQILGFTNIDNVGQNGLEGYYDTYLKGVDGFAYTNTDLAGRETEDTVTKYVQAIPGCDITLSIDLNIQSFAEYAVFSAQNAWKSKSASMIVMDCTDGGVLAMASTPSFDLNDPPRNDIDMLNALSKNKMIVDVYEPGSTFKIFTTAAALEHSVTKESDRFYCNGSRTVDGQRIKCWRSIGHGSQDLPEGVMNSCNCVFMDLALRLGTDKLYDSLRAFGFNAKTNIDFYGESKGIMMKQESVKTVDLARIGFGQAVAVTPLQLITGVSAVVNGGTLYEPYFVKGICDYQGKKVYDHSPKVVRNPISNSTSERMRAMLERVVSEGGGKNAKVNGFRIGGKTGTAQKYENGSIAQGKYVSSFIGFAPVENPKYVVLMIVDEPGPGAYYGSITAAPFAGEVFKKIFDYNGLRPTLETGEIKYVKMPDLIGMSAAEAADALKSSGLQCEIAGSGGSVVSTLPIAGESVEEGGVVLIRLAEEFTP